MATSRRRWQLSRSVGGTHPVTKLAPRRMLLDSVRLTRPVKIPGLGRRTGSVMACRCRPPRGPCTLYCMLARRFLPRSVQAGICTLPLLVRWPSSAPWADDGSHEVARHRQAWPSTPSAAMSGSRSSPSPMTATLVTAATASFSTPTSLRSASRARLGGAERPHGSRRRI